MGGPLSRLLADLIIENKIEAKIKENREWKKSFNWVQLIDDTFMNWTESEARLDEFFGNFPFFGIQLTRSGSTIDTTVYKTAAIHTLTLRALNYCSTKELLTQELAHITQVFLDNGFPLEAIQRIINMKSHPKEASETQRLDESHAEQSIIDFSKAFYAPYHPHARKMFEVRNLALPTYTKRQLHLVTSYLKEDQKGTNGTRHMWFILSPAQNNRNST